MVRKHSILAVSLVALVASSSAFASGSGLPAVSAPNGKFAVRGGTQDGDGSVYADLAYTVPFGHAFGIQIDGIFGYFGGTNDGVARGAAHFFWRDPQIGLLGAYGSSTTIDSNNYFQIGVEAQVYLGRISLEGKAGLDDLDSDDGFFGSATIAYYFTDDLRGWAGVRHSEYPEPGRIAPGEVGAVGAGTVGVVGLEYQTQWGTGGRSVSVFAEGRFGEDDYNAAWGGLRVYFGAQKSLIRRHREDDPGTDVPDLTEFAQPAPPAPLAPPPPRPK